MDYRLLCRLLGIIAVLIGATMVFSLPWAVAFSGSTWECERSGFIGLLVSMAICFVVGGMFVRLGRGTQGRLFQKEAMAVVSLSWVLATLLGALPYVLSGTCFAEGERMTFVDAMFEAQSGFSTTGATVLTDLEDPELVPRCILFWRSSTHFLGGLGIIVLFVAILGQGSAGKALMRAEMPGPSPSGVQARMQHTAWMLVFVYFGLNAALTVTLMFEGLSLFTALCHAFGTMATGGFSTYNASVAHFATVPGLNGPLIEMTITVFMILAGTNFTLLYSVAVGKVGGLVADVEWKTYVTILVVATLLVLAFGLWYGDFYGSGMGGSGSVHEPKSDSLPVGNGIRFSVFQVVSIMTTTGFCTADFDQWNSFALGLLLVLMFVGGCAGSTGGGLKVIRHILFTKILWLELEQSFHPNVVRPLRLAGQPVTEKGLQTKILIYFGLITAIFVFSWLFTITVEPDSTWTEQGHMIEHKLRDAAGCVAATLNNIGPGFGVVGATQNYANFTPWTKLLYIWLMMLGRLELFVVLVLFFPSFWKSQ